MLDRVAPWLFVVLWSTGYIGSKVGAEHAEPMTFLALRFGAVLVVLAPLLLFLGARLPRPRDFGRAAISGMLIHAIYLGGVMFALRRGMPAGIAALVISLQPIVTALVSTARLGELILVRHWFGLAAGLSGTALVLAPKLSVAGTTGIGPGSIFACMISLAAITIGTLYQKAKCSHIDLRSAAIPQYFGAFVVCAAGAYLFETRVVSWTPELVLALAWLVLVLSIGAIGLLMMLIAKNAAWRTSALFYLVPPTTAVMAWALFGETLSQLQLGGLALVCVGVVLIGSGGTQKPHDRGSKRLADTSGARG